MSVDDAGMSRSSCQMVPRGVTLRWRRSRWFSRPPRFARCRDRLNYLNGILKAARASQARWNSLLPCESLGGPSAIMRSPTRSCEPDKPSSNSSDGLLRPLKSGRSILSSRSQPRSSLSIRRPLAPHFSQDRLPLVPACRALRRINRSCSAKRTTSRSACSTASRFGGFGA